MQLTKMASGITPAKRKKTVPLSSVLDMLENSPSKRPRLSDPGPHKERPPEPVKTPVRRALVTVDDEDSPRFEIRSFYNPNKHTYLSPLQRRDSLQGSKEVDPGLTRSAGPKLMGNSTSKQRRASKSVPNRGLKTKSERKRFPLKDRSSSNLCQTKTQNSATDKPSRRKVKAALTFQLGIKSASPAQTCKQVFNDPYSASDEFDQPLTWDVDKHTNKFFKGRPAAGGEEPGAGEKGTTLVVKQGFNLTFVHHRGDTPRRDSSDKGRKLSTSAKTRSPVVSAARQSRQTGAGAEDDLMIQRLKEELLREAQADNAYEFASSSDDSLPLLDKEKKITNGIPNEESTPDLFSHSPQIVTAKHHNTNPQTAVRISKSPDKKLTIKEMETCNTTPSEDSACHSGQTNSVDLFEEGSSSGRNSPSVSSEISCCPSDVSESTSSNVSGPVLRGREATVEDQKYFPIFRRAGGQRPTTTKVTKIFRTADSPGQRSSQGSPNLHKLPRGRDNSEQLIIDAGQSRLGATQCEVCRMVYTPGQSSDEATHARFHQHLITALKFPGWKKERVLQDYDDDGGRVLMVLPDDPKYALKKVEDINKIMSQELGYSDAIISAHPSYKVFLYISDEKKVVGCCVAEPVTQGYRVIADSQPSSLTGQPGHRPWCSETTPSPAQVGISRIWVYGQNRRQGVATKLLECVRHWFEFGVVIGRDMLAFSDPTPDGKQLGAQYTGSHTFLVYKYNGM